MQQLIRICAIRDRVARLNLSLRHACEQVGAPAATVYRWIEGGVDPRHQSYVRTCERLETWLAEREALLLTELSGIGVEGRPPRARASA